LKLGLRNIIRAIYNINDVIIDKLREKYRIEEENAALKKESEELKKKVYEMEVHIQSSPGGDLYFSAMEDFRKNAARQNS
jgi:hypothetical protein